MGKFQVPLLGFSGFQVPPFTFPGSAFSPSPGYRRVVTVTSPRPKRTLMYPFMHVR
jgi:hypothetical protein